MHTRQGILPAVWSVLVMGSLVAAAAAPRKLAGGFRFTEGPAADAAGNVYFTDIPSNRILRWSVEGKLSTFLEDSGGANGLFFDAGGNLIACLGKGRRLVSVTAGGDVTTLAEGYGGRAFNGLNDLWIDPRGGITFTDPRYGPDAGREQDGEHVYYLGPERRQVRRVIDNLIRPNGLVGTPDGRSLYVTDPGAGRTYAYRVRADGTLSERRLLTKTGGDGMTLDAQGRVYLAAADGVRIYAPDGTFIERIVVPEQPSNCCFGGADGRTLFITARQGLYAVAMRVGGAVTQRGRWTLLDCTGRPDARHETSFVACGGACYLIGGRESRRIDRFDPGTRTWTKMQAVTPLIHHFQPVVWHGRILMVCAMTGAYPKEPPLSRVQIYDPATDAWSQGDTIPAARRRGSAGTVVYRDRIYVVGGITLGHTSGTRAWFDAYNPATGAWRVLPDAPHARDHFHAVVVGDRLYCLGGRNTSYHEPGNFTAFFGAVIPAIDCYDFRTGTWRTLDVELPVGSAAAGTAVLDGRILYFGGETAQKGPALDRSWLFDPQTERFTELARMNQGRHGSQAVVHGGRVIIAAGSPQRGGGHTDTVEVFSF